MIRLCGNEEYTNEKMRKHKKLYRVKNKFLNVIK